MGRAGGDVGRAGGDVGRGRCGQGEMWAEEIRAGRGTGQGKKYQIPMVLLATTGR